MFKANPSIPAPASLALPVELAQRLMKRDSEQNVLTVADIVLIFSRGPATGIDAEFTQKDIEFCRTRALAALEYAAQCEAAN